tara:strand:+ start:266 stop:2143 length:1878 start_codon:yes stop_codon:yes gene_type:complete
MFTQIGYYLLIFSLILSLYLNFFSLVNYKKNLTNFYQVLTLLSLQLFFVISIFAALVISFVNSDFSNITVYNNSHSTKPLFYKISGTWGNHEGSLLLWLMVLTLSVFLFGIKSKKFSINFRLITIFFQQLIISGFLIFIIFTSNPFISVIPIPIEGLGLNPILQDPALAIHPPILYVGYVGTSIIFSLSLAGVLENNINKEWAAYTKIWILISWIFLTIGILLGSIWAYYELGWGGFWFWDPVENISLMPWFCLTALLHTIIVLEKRSVLQSWTIILSIASFTLSISGTFLVRSGILNSIHTFANDPSRGIFILIYLFLLVSLALFIYFIYFENEKKKEEGIFLINKETSILINNWFMMYFLAVVLVGTIYPIFLEVISNEKISIGPPFYHKLLIPFLILFIIIMILETKLKWIKTDLKKIKKNGLISFILLAIFCLILIEYLGSNLIIASILLASAFLLIVLTILDIIKNKIFISQKISHFGFSLLILSILLNNIYSKEISSNMKVGEEINFTDKKIKFLSLKATEKKNFKSVTGKFQIVDEKNRIKFFYPEIRIYNQPNIVTSEADIITNIFTDNFLVFNIINDDEFFNVRYQYKPFMFLIWISTMLIAIGGMYSLYNRTYEK